MTPDEFINYMRKLCVEKADQRITTPLLSEEYGRLEAYNEMRVMIDVYKEKYRAQS